MKRIEDKITERVEVMYQKMYFKNVLKMLDYTSFNIRDHVDIDE